MLSWFRRKPCPIVYDKNDLTNAFLNLGYEYDKVRNSQLWGTGFISVAYSHVPNLLIFTRPVERGTEIATVIMTPTCDVLGSCKVLFGTIAAAQSEKILPGDYSREMSVFDFMRQNAPDVQGVKYKEPVLRKLAF